MSVIVGKVKWAHVLANNPNTTFTPKWTINVLLDQVSEKTLIDLNVKDKIKTEEDGTKYVVISRNVETSTGKEKRPPVVIGKNGLPFNELIGNGSVCAVQFRVEPWEYNKKTGIRLDLQGVLVQEHVPYSGGDGEELKAFTDNSGHFVSDEDVPF